LQGENEGGGHSAVAYVRIGPCDRCISAAVKAWSIEQFSRRWAFIERCSCEAGRQKACFAAAECAQRGIKNLEWAGSFMKISKRNLVLACAAAGANSPIGSAVHAAPFGRGVLSLVTDGFAPSGIAPNGCGLSALGTLTVTNSGGVSGKYFPGYFNVQGGSTVGYVALAGFLPTDFPEFCALQVAINGVELAPTDTRLATLMADIKAYDDPDSIKNTGITTVAGSPFAPIFPGYDIVIPTRKT